MALKAIANKEEFDSFSEDIQSHYSPDSKDPDVFRLSVTPANGIELADVSGLKSALQKERNQVSTLKTSLSSFDGLDAEEARTALEELEAIKKDGGGNKTRDEVRAELDASYKQKFEADKEALTKKFTTDIESKDKKIGTLSSQLEKQLIDGEAVSAITKAGGSVELLLPIVRGSSKAISLDDGRIVPRILDSNGQERMSPKAGSSDPMSYDEFVAELKGDKAYGRAFDATGTSGSGATGSGEVDTGNALVLSRDAAMDPVKYRMAREKAAKQGKQLQFQE